MLKYLSALLFLLILATSAHAKDNPQAMIVFDASGSMWGQIEGTPKIQIAKEALSNVVSQWDENTHLGLIAYGHRKKGDCNDIEILIPVGPVDKNGMIATVQKIQPKGKTPISRAIKIAAEELRYTEEKATVILISDGKENCDADPCGTAKALESEGIDFIAHVIGFDVDKQTGEELRCIANATGGEYFSAKNASSLNDAMGKVIEKVQKKEAPKPIVKKPENNLKIVAVEVEGGPWIKANHSIYTDTGDVDERGDRVTNCYSTKDKACKESIPVGSYIIESRYNKFRLKTPVEIKGGETSDIEIIMGGTGKINIIAREVAASPMIKANHSIYTDTGDEDELGDRVTNCYSTKDKSCKERIPVGNYIIESRYNKFNLKTPVTVKFGETSEVEIFMGETGKINIIAREVAAGPIIKANHSIYTDTGDEDELGDRVTNCYSTKDKSCKERIPVGNYIIESRYNKFNLKTPVTVKFGETSEVEIFMGETGKINIIAREVAAGPIIKANHSIYTDTGDEDERGDRVTNCYSTKDKSCKERIPVGKYIIESRYNEFNLKTPVEVKFGETSDVEIITGQTGKVELTASAGEAGKWIKAGHFIYKDSGDEDELGDRVATCNSAKDKPCKVRIPLGKYVIETQYEGGTQKTPFELKAGETSKINVNFAAPAQPETTENTEAAEAIEATADDASNAERLDALEMFTDEQGE